MKLMACLAGVSVSAGVVAAQPALAIRFDNGQSEITVAPGSQVQVQVWVTGMPAVGTPIPWTTPPGTGQIGEYEGFLFTFFNIMGTTTDTATWSGLGFPSGYGLPLPPDPPHGWPSGPNVLAINAGVGFNPPITLQDFPLWYGTLTVGSADVHIETALQPSGLPSQVGIEVALSGIDPQFNVSQYLTTLNGSAVIHVPAPAGLIVLGLGALGAARRRR